MQCAGWQHEPADEDGLCGYGALRAEVIEVHAPTVMVEVVQQAGRPDEQVRGVLLIREQNLHACVEGG